MAGEVANVFLKLGAKVAIIILFCVPLHADLYIL
jgi:hypothetical protein